MLYKTHYVEGSLYHLPDYMHLSSSCLSIKGKPSRGFRGGSVVKNPPAKAGDLGLIPGPGRCPGEGTGNSLQYFCLENSMDGGAW